MIAGIFIGLVLILYLLNIELGRALEYGSPSQIGAMALIMGCLALSLAWYTYRDYRLRLKRRWPHAMGRVQDIEIMGGLAGLKRVRIEYVYMVKDREYHNDMFDFAQRFATEPRLKMHPELRDYRDIRQLKERLIKVYYDPRCPWRSAISRKGEQSALVTSIPSAIVIFFCLYNLGKIGLDFLG